MMAGKFEALKKLLSKGGDEGQKLLSELKGMGSKAMETTPKQALEGLQGMGSKGIGALDQQLAKVPFMRGEQDPLFKIDEYTDPRKRNALLAALGLGGAGAAGYGMADD